MNCDSTRFSIIDINGVLSFYDMNGVTKEGDSVLDRPVLSLKLG